VTIEDIQEAMEEILERGCCEAACNKCGYVATVEPDGDYICPECEQGRIQSPLVEAGMI